MRHATEAAGLARALRGADPGDVVPVAELDAETLGLGAIERPDGVGIDEAVARRERRADDLLAGAVQQREARPDLRRLEKLDAEPVGVLELPLLARTRPERGIGIQPQVAPLAEADLGGMRAEEVQRRATGLDVHRLPPGGPRPAGVELGGGVEAGEVEVEHHDAVDPPACQRPGDPGPDDAAADDENPHALHCAWSSGLDRPPHAARRTVRMGCEPGRRPLPADPLHLSWGLR